MDRLRRLPAIAAAFFTFIAAFEVQAEVQIGDVRQPEYKGAIGQLATGDEHRLTFSEPVYAEETVLTDAQASTALQFLDNTQLRVGTNSKVRLDKFVFDPGTGTGEALLNFGTGAFRYVSGSLGKQHNMKLATPTAVLSIRGTELVISVAPDGTTQVAVFDGEIEVAPCGGESALARTGETATITSKCTGVSVTLGLTVPEDPTLFADLNDIVPAAGPSVDEFSDQTRGQTTSASQTPAEPEPEPETPSGGGGVLSGLGNLGRIGEGLGGGFGNAGGHSSGGGEGD
jgi:FecR protein